MTRKLYDGREEARGRAGKACRAVARPLAFACAVLLGLGAASCLGHNSSTPPLAVPTSGAGLLPLTAIPTRAGTPSTAYPLTATRSDGRQITLRSQPHSIAVLEPGLAEVLYAIGAGPQVAATSSDCDYPAETAASRRVDPPSQGVPDLSGATVDLVLSTGAPANVIAALDRGSAPVIDLPPVTSFNELLSEIQFMGDVAGHPAEAQRVAAGMRSRLDDTQRRLARIQSGPVVQVIPGDAAALPELTRDLLAQLRARSAAPGDRPDVTIRLTGGDPGTATPTDPLLIPAVLVERAGPRAIEGLLALARALYPGLLP